MSLAAVGYLVACIVGVIMLNVLKRRGSLAAPAKAPDAQSAQDFFAADDSASVSASIDILSIQAALVLMVYLAAYLVTRGITGALGAAAPGLAKTISPLLWGFNFIIGSALAIALRAMIGRGKRGRVRALKYQNNYLLNRISGFFFDIMIVAGIASINLEDLRGLWVPFLLMAVCGGVITWLHLKAVCKAVYPDYYYHGLVSMFGMLTGTISSGVLLLREIDPDLSTPAANNLITGSSFGIVLGAPILVLVTLAARSELLCWVTLGIVLIYFSFLCFLIYRFQGKKAAGTGDTGASCQ
jgi:ESS family glutamate:Na+ symporter